MVNICIFEDTSYQNLLPLTLNRPAYHLQLGIDTLLDKLNRFFSYGNITLHCREALKPLIKATHPQFPINNINVGTACLFINGRTVMTQDLFLTITTIDKQHNHLFTYQGEVVACYLKGNLLDFMRISLNGIPTAKDLIHYLRPKCIAKELEKVSIINNLWELINLNASTLTSDFIYFNQPGIIKGTVNPFTAIYNENNIFIDKGSIVEDFVVLNAKKGPIYIEKGVHIHAHSRLEGPLFIGKNTIIKGGTISTSSIGAFCKIAGEVSHSIIQDYSNKGHYGFLGHSYIGKWVNLGAGTTTSNLKNTYNPIQLETTQGPLSTNQTFLGSIIGDHVKTGIGTTLNSGSIIGFGSNLYAQGFHDRLIPNFSWGQPQDYTSYQLDKFIKTAKIVMTRRNVALSVNEKNVLAMLHQDSLKAKVA